MGELAKLDEEEVCSRVGLKKSSWRVYVSLGKAPKPDGKLGMARGPFWYRKTIDDWDMTRRGRKNRGHGSGVGYINRAAYQAAADWVSMGLWKVYPETGIIDLGEGSRLSVLGGPTGYLAVGVNWIENGQSERSTVLLHRVIWEHRFVGTDEFGGMRKPIADGMVIDHINRISYDNRVANLREVTQKENLLNRRVSYGVFPEPETEASGMS